MLDDYVLGEELGQGAFGVVYACTHRAPKDQKEEHAVKMIDKVETPVKEIQKEVEILDKVRHPNVIEYIDVYYEKVFVCIVMAQFKGGDLIAGMQHHWDRKGRIPCEAVKHIERQCALALDVLHHAGIAHRDVKGDNYLLDRIDITDKDCKCVLTDFGTATKCKIAERVQGKVGTRTYWSPEFWSNDYGQKVDIWAYGVIVYGLLEGRFPFKDEQAAKLRKPKLHDDLPADCVDFVRTLLKKEDSRRSSAAQAMEHPWIKEVSKLGAPSPAEDDRRLTPRGPAEVWKKNEEFLVEQGPKKVHAERRYELVERLENAAKAAGAKEEKHFLDKSWEVAYRHQAKKVTFEWQDASAALAAKVWDPEAGRVVGATTEHGEVVFGDDETCSLFDRGAIESMMKDHNIDLSLFGQGAAKTLDQFMEEVKAGASRLMLDAAEYKKMVRVVDVVILRIAVMKPGGGEKRFLVEGREQYPDGRKREGLNRLPATKRDPHEDVKRVLLRILKELLGMQDCRVLFDFRSKEVYEEEDESPSYPGVRTVYRRETIEGSVSVTDPAILARIGVESKEEYAFTDAKGNTKYFKWLTEAECNTCQPQAVRLRAPSSTYTVSGLVMAPISIDEEALAKYLSSHGVNIEAFGQGSSRTLTEFADELANSEASIARDKNGQVIRVVDLIGLVMHRDNGKELLVEKCQADKAGVKALNRLPGSKKHSQETHFQTAIRLLERIHVDEAWVNVNTKPVRILEEYKDSPSYPGMRTLYRKRIIQADFAKPDEASP